MHKPKLPPYPQTFSTKLLLESDSCNYNMPSADQKMHGHLEIVRSPTALIKISPYSKTLYTEWLLDPDSYQYNMLSADQVLYGDLDVERLRKALNRYVAEHVLLNSHIQVCNEEPYWGRNTTINELEYSAATASEAELLAYVQQPFNLYTGPLYRFKLLRLSEEVHRLIIVLHHLVMDGISINAGVFDAISNYYNRPNYTAKYSVPTQSNLLTKLEKKLSANLEKNKNAYKTFWQQQLVEIENIDLSFLHAPSANSFQQDASERNPIAEIRFGFDADVLDKLTRITTQYQLTPYIYSQCIFAILLHKYTSQQNFAINYPISIKEGADFIYGSQVNLNLIPYHFAPDTTPIKLLKYVRDFYEVNIKNKNQYGHCPISDILQTVDNNKQLLQVSFAQAHFRDKPFCFFGIEKTESLHTLSMDGVTKNSLIFEQDATSHKLNYRVKYDRVSINTELLHAFINSYKKLFIDVLEDLNRGNNLKAITDYSLLSAEQYQQLVYGFNQTEKCYQRTKTLHQLFEDQVAKTPKAIALVYEGETWTYAQLNEEANQLAHYLRNNFFIQPDDVIGLCLKPGYHMFIGVWAVLKSGAAYLPIDCAYPDERVNYLLDDTKAKAVITDQRGAHQFKYVIEKNKVNIVNLDAEQIKFELLKKSNVNLNHIAQPHNLAYVIYTSGTQGQPKGVLIEHSSVTNYVTYVISENQLSETSIGAKYASFSFDASVIEIYPIFLSGGKLCIIKEEDRLDCEKVNDFFHQYGVTFAFLPTPFAELFFELENTSLKNLMVGGGKLKKYIPRKYKTINAYGPTEVTVQAASYVVDNESSIPIGKPINNVRCYVVDSNCHLLPIGSIGELLIGGDGLAREYLNLPELTAQKFICNPFQSKQEKATNQNMRLYKTGDLVRWLPNGNLEYIGRNDDQVKIRGHRVELSEIEQYLMQYPEIQQVVVIAGQKEDASNEAHIVAYYVALKKLEQNSLNNYLSKKLPTYMLPAAYIHMQTMPLATSGKINKLALPQPNWGDEQLYIAAINTLEKAVCSAYAHILGLKENQVGVHHDFFELGGSSIAAIQLTFLLQRHFKINVADIYKLKTPAKLVLKLPPAKKDFLLSSLQISKLYLNKITFALHDMEEQKANSNTVIHYQQYLEEVKHLNPDILTKNNIRSVLLTGATGFLGCHLLATLLAETTYTIYLPVRAESDAAAFDRLNQKFKYYFKTGLENKLDRIIFFAAHLHEKDLGLEQSRFETMVANVDSIIHCAALVKYYGHDEEFYQANILPTIQLLELAKLTSNKDFHYISSVGVLLDGHVIGQDYSIFTEGDDKTNLVNGNHPYIQSKYQAEQLVIKYRSQGINGSIYRIGNVALNSQTHMIQENFEENMFFAHLKAMINFQLIPEEIRQMEVSPVEYTALALVKLFDKKALSNQTHHVFNPKIVDLQGVIAYFMDFKRQEYSMEKFIEKVISNIDRSDDMSNNACLLMLYQFWLQQIDSNHSTTIRITQKKTECILAKLGFQWPPLKPSMFQELIHNSPVL